MKEKRKKATDGLFFDNALTSHNRSLMGKIKSIAKTKNFVVFLRGSKIYAKKNDKTVQVIKVRKI